MADVIDFSQFQRGGVKKLNPDLVEIMVRLTREKRVVESIYAVQDIDWVSFLMIHMILHAKRNGHSVDGLKENVDAAWKIVEENPQLGMYL